MNHNEGWFAILIDYIPTIFGVAVGILVGAIGFKFGFWGGIIGFFIGLSIGAYIGQLFAGVAMLLVIFLPFILIAYLCSLVSK